MDIWHLQVFQKVVEMKGFSSASKAVSLTQPTISSHIKELEAHYGCKLLDRLGKQALPTKAGELLYEYAGKLISLFAETESAMAEFTGNISGRLVMGGSTIPGSYILPRVIGQFVKQYPDVNITVIVGDTEQIIDEILNYRIEFSVVGAQTDSPKIDQQQLVADDMRLIVPADHPWAHKKQVSLEMMMSEPFIIREQGSGTLQSIQKSFAVRNKAASSLHITAELGSTAAVIQGIKNHVGISILSTIAVSEELAAGSLKALTIKNVNLKRHFYLTTHKDRTASPLCREFMGFLERTLSPGKK
jgi:DNA-binding transcriptional LysR family regulator